MHDGVNAESEGMVVGGDNGCGSCSTNVSKDDLAACVAAYGAEVGVVEGRLDCFVEHRMEVRPDSGRFG